METGIVRAVVAGVQLPGITDEEHRSSLDELTRLAHTLGLEVIARVTQRREGLSKAAVLGSGKLKELARWTGGSGVIPSPANPKEKKATYISGSQSDEEPAEEEIEPEEEELVEEAPSPTPAEKAKVVLIDHDISPSQSRNIERAVEAEVLDRTAVILAIFERHARTREAKIEVEIARLAYMAPRLREVGGGGDRQRGGIGGRGAGESSMELDRRKVRDRIAELKKELELIEATARTRRARRAEESTVALVGYTNAGKSSLMRGLTGSEVYIADKLFATLDTTVRALKPPSKPRILISDTVGFIKKLPHGLVASFRATLEAAAEADLLLHVIDASDPAFVAQMSVTRELLQEIKADAPSIALFNKIDRVSPETKQALAAQYPEAVLMSAKSAEDVARLRARIIDHFEARMADEELLVPYDRQAVVAQIHDQCRVLSESWDERGVTLTVRAEPRVLARLRTALG